VSDVFSKAKRSEVMSRIRGRGNRATELAFASLLRTHKISGWRRHWKIRLCGPTRTSRVKSVRPDFVFPRLKVVIFIDGCFWHSCPKHATLPRNNSSFWAAKLAANRDRDRYVTRALRRRGWRVKRFWEHDVNSRETIVRRLHSLDLAVPYTKAGTGVRPPQDGLLCRSTRP
jgi:DNA mismatch endonuclease (patch repair protein)